MHACHRGTFVNASSLQSARPTVSAWSGIGLALVAALALGAAQAQDSYPNRPIRLVVPNAPGTTSDIYGRVILNELSKRLKVPGIVDNRAGAEGRIAARYFITTPPDGYTLFLGTTSTHAINPVMFRNNGYDPVRDMTTIAMMTRNYVALSVPAGSPVRSVADLLARARAAPRKLNIAAGSSLTNIGSNAFLALSNIEMTFVPYKSTAGALTELMAGRADAMFVDLGNGIAQMRAGTIRPIATTGAARLKILPDVPSMEEAGFPGFQMTGWSVLSAPAGVPPAIADKLNGEIRSMLGDPEVARHFTGNGSEIFFAGVDEANAFVQSESRRWADMMKRSGIAPE